MLTLSVRLPTPCDVFIFGLSLSVMLLFSGYPPLPGLSSLISRNRLTFSLYRGDDAPQSP
jgi:hypothetical protein